MSKRKDDVNGKQVAGGCLTFILMAIVISLNIFILWKFLLLIAVIVLGLFLTNAFKD